jgi:thioredoxin
MKKLSLLVLLTLSAGFFGCTDMQGNQTDKEAKIDTPVSTPDPDEVKPEFLTYETFKEKVWDFEANPEEWKYKGDVPCIIDFYADWCKPCKMIAPIMEDIAKDYDGKVKVYKINTDKERQLAGVFGVRSIPMVLFVPQEGRPTKSEGALPKDEYIRIVNELLLNKKQ